MKKDKNELGIGFGEMMDSDLLIDTDTGKVITNDNIPTDTTENPEEGKTDAQTDPKKEDLIEVDVETPQSSDNPPIDIDDAGASSSSDNNQNVLKSLAKALYDEGVISELDEESLNSTDESEAEVLIKLIGSEISKNVDSYKSNLPDRVKKVIDNYEEGVPLDVIIGLESTNQRLEGITDEQIKGDDNLQKLVITDSFKRMGLTDEKVQKRIQQFEDLGQLEDEAIDALANTKEYYAEALENEKVKAQEKRTEYAEAQKKTLEDLKKSVMATEELVAGVKITNQEKEKIYESMTKVIDQDKNKNPMNTVMVTRSKNPMGFEQLLHYYHNLGLFNIEDDGTLKPDLSKLKSGAKSSAISELNKSLKKGSPAFAGAPKRERLDSDKMRDNLASMKDLFNG